MTNIAKITLVAAVAAGMALTSCNSNSSSDVRTTQRITGCYAQVTDLQDGTVTYSTDIIFGLELNWTEATADITVSGLKTPSAIPTFTMSGLQWGAASGEDGKLGWVKSSASQVAVQASAINSFIITDFQINWMDRLDLGAALGFTNYYQPACTFSFVLDNRYRVVGSRSPYLLFGKCSSTDPDGKVFETNQSYFVITLDFTNMTASIGIDKARFQSDMPSMSMQFPSIPMTVASDGTITLDAASLIPQTADKTPQPSFPISDLHAVLSPKTGMVLDFKCNVRNARLFTVHADVTYMGYVNLQDGTDL